MRVFVTGATGFIGSAVVRELVAAGHRVLGLSRSDAGAKGLVEAGAEVHRGSLEDLASLRQGATSVDAVIHCAFIHDFTSFAANCAVDAAAIRAMGEVLAGSNKPFIATSGILGLAKGRPGTEEDSPSPEFPRRSEVESLALVEKGVRAMVVRLPPTVHGDGDHGFVPMLVSTARQKGFSAYVGDGSNRWPAVHRLDAARAYRLALEKGAAGARFNVVDEEGIPFKSIAEAIGKRLGVPAVSKTAEEVGALLGFVGHVAGMDGSATSAITRATLGWAPSHPKLLVDLAEGTYFQ